MIGIYVNVNFKLLDHGTYCNTSTESAVGAMPSMVGHEISVGRFCCHSELPVYVRRGLVQSAILAVVVSLAVEA